MSGKYAFTKSLKEVRFLFCQTSDHSAATRFLWPLLYPIYSTDKPKVIPYARLPNHEEKQSTHSDYDSRGIGDGAEGVGEIWYATISDTRSYGLRMLSVEYGKEKMQPLDGRWIWLQ